MEMIVLMGFFAATILLGAAIYKIQEWWEEQDFH